ncbi:hypothetical protein FRC11_010048 [Ceratobasidium sp. 423]|nr:hypothetical protein FRC11_010048 [Ceratobasidium sp. 423]
MEPTPVYVYQRWKDAQKALDHAMQHYLNSTVALRSSLCSSTYPVELLSVRNTLAETWPDYSPSLDKDSKLAQAQVYLNQIRNSLLTINTLPLEILLKIFRLASFSALHTQDNPLVPFSRQQDDPKNLFDLTHVCSYWRKILLSTSSFWSRFEFDTRNSINNEYQRAEVYLDRSRGAASQSLFVDKRVYRYWYHNDFDLVLKMIESRLDNLTQLALLNFADTQLVMRTTSYWLRHGKPGVLQSLTIQMESHLQRRESIYTHHTDLVEKAPPMLASIHSLFLRGVKFDWDSPVYHNLVQLHIGNLPYESCPHIHELLEILSVCPLLHTLKISNMAIRPGASSTPLRPIYLTELKHLDLVGFSDSSLNLLLPKIFPQSQGLSLRVALGPLQDRSSATIRSFLDRTNVTELFLQQEFIAECLPAVPNLRALVIDLGERHGNPCLSTLTYSDKTNTRRIPRCPKLETLYLVTGSVTVWAVQEIVETHPLLRKLGFSACYVYLFEDELRYWLKPYVEEAQFDSRVDEEAVFYWSQFMA